MKNPFGQMARDYNKADKKKSRVTSGLGHKELAKELERMANEVGMRCHYSGVLLTLDCRDCFKLSFDRIDNSIGHTLDNMVVTSKILNIMRGNMDYDQWVSEAQWKSSKMLEMAQG
ncbi:uncharacterized protein METZ01_LOCUS366385 [marine metagenome]|uniref:Uncharacterized protein n=1 Tax=marine metagenome TaxID=408172 RepID=A0A382SX77_9ZZZZ|tara:strand:+ start:370 stop:717 length:348 start_codon:yes stop_codon:yes gene_type:complete